jgi:hypothetical protein
VADVGAARRGWHFLRNVFARERLAEAPERARGPRRPSALRVLLAPEPLPLAPERTPRRHRGTLRALFAPERLSQEPPGPPRPRLGLLRALLAAEQLPEEPPAPPRPRRHHWLAWLLSPERLDSPDRQE